MRLIYTLHARSRMLERGISEEDVEFVLSNPDFVDEGRDGALIASRKINGKSVKIIYNLKGNNTIIITVC
jgi:hypothetical protein